MSLLVSSPVDDVDASHSRQQDDDGNHHVRAMRSTGAAFALPLRDGVVPSPDRDRRFASFDQHTQRKTSRSSSSSSSAADNGADGYLHASPYKQLHGDVQKLKEALQVMRAEKDHEIAHLKEQLAQLSAKEATRTAADHEAKSSSVDTAPPRLVPWMHSITDKGEIQTNRLGRHASFKTTKALQETPRPSNSSPLAERIAAAFFNPVLSLPYLHSIQFGADLVELSAQVSSLLESEARCLSLASPVYVFGDLHGNMTDLNFFASHLWRFGFGLSAGNFLFLGDYVDRGASSLECVAYLFAHKLLHPHKVFLLRGNHETRAVNGLEAYYGSGCFLTQCRSRFGHDEGYIVWHQINHAFDRLPLAATIDGRVFCVHGGIPRPPAEAAASLLRLDAIKRLPATAPMDALDKKVYDANPQLSMVSDLLWGDPAREEHEPALDAATGFGRSARGGTAVSFGTRAIDDFLTATGCSLILRAHEAAVDGVAVGKSARVLTVFSTSKDHALGDEATCGCVLVDRDRVAAINRVAGQPREVRRRRSVTSLQSPPSTAATVVGGASVPVAATTAAQAVLMEAGSSSVGTSGRTRRRSSHRDAYPSLEVRTATPVLGSGTAAAAASIGRTGEQDDCDSTDDEATPRARGSHRVSAAGGAATAAAVDASNQSEDD